MVKHRTKKGSSRNESRNDRSSTSHSGSEHRISTSSSSNSRNRRSRHNASSSDRAGNYEEENGADGASTSETSPSFVHVQISSRRPHAERSCGSSLSMERSTTSLPRDSLLCSRNLRPITKNRKLLPNPERRLPTTRQPPLPVKLRIGSTSASASSVPRSQTPPRPPVPPSNDDDEDEDPCPICLDKRTDEAAILYCMHRYCFQCIKRWAEGSNNTCPLCKMLFSEIAYNIQSDSSYHVYKIKQRRNLVMPNRNLVLSHLAADQLDAPRPHSTRLGLGVPSSGRPENSYIQLQLQRQLLMMAMRGMRGESVSSVRLVLYQSERRTMVPPQYDYCPTPDDFTTNATLITRLVPFLVRELVVVFGIAEPVRDWIITDLQILVRTYHVESSGFALQVRSIFNERVGQPVLYPRHYIDIFVDEMRSFVIYNHEIEIFDRLSSSSMRRPRRPANATVESDILTLELRRLESRQSTNTAPTPPRTSVGSNDIPFRRAGSRFYSAYTQNMFTRGFSDAWEATSMDRLAAMTSQNASGSLDDRGMRWPDYLSLLQDYVTSSSSENPTTANSTIAGDLFSERSTRPEEPPQRLQPSSRPAPMEGGLSSSYRRFGLGSVEQRLDRMDQPGSVLETRRSPWQPLACPWSPTPLYNVRPSRQPLSTTDDGQTLDASAAEPVRLANGSVFIGNNSLPPQREDHTNAQPTPDSPLETHHFVVSPSPPEPSTSAAIAPSVVPVPVAAPAPVSALPVPVSVAGSGPRADPVSVIEISSDEEREADVELDPLFRPQPTRGDEDCIILGQSVALSSEDEATQQPRPSSSRNITENPGLAVPGPSAAGADEPNPWRPWQGRRRHRRDPTVSELIAYKKQRASSASDSSDGNLSDSSGTSSSTSSRRALEWGSSVYFHSHQSRVDERRRRRLLRLRQRLSRDGVQAMIRVVPDSPGTTAVETPTVVAVTSASSSTAAGALRHPEGADSCVKRSNSPVGGPSGEPDSSAGQEANGAVRDSDLNSPQLLNALEVGKVFADLELAMAGSSAETTASENGVTRRASSTYAYPIELDAMLAPSEPESSSAEVEPLPPPLLLSPEPEASAKREPQLPSPSSSSCSTSPAKRALVRCRPRVPKLGFTFINLTGEAGTSAGERKTAVSPVTALRRRVRAQPELAGVSEARVMETLSNIARPKGPTEGHSKDFRREFPKWRERPASSETAPVVDLVASDGEETPVVAPPPKVIRKEAPEPVRRKMRAGVDPRPPSPPVVDLVEEEEAAEGSSGSGSASVIENDAAEAAEREVQKEENMRALEFVYPRTTAEFYRSLRGEAVRPSSRMPSKQSTMMTTAATAATTAAAPKADEALAAKAAPEVVRKKMKLSLCEEQGLSDADKLSSIVEEMDIEVHDHRAGREKSAMCPDKRAQEVEEMEVDYIPEAELRKEASRCDRELLLAAPAVSEVESMEVETSASLDAAAAADAVVTVAAARKEEGDDEKPSVEPKKNFPDRPEQRKKEAAPSAAKPSKDSADRDPGLALPQNFAEEPRRNVSPRRRCRSLSDVREPAVKDARVGTSPAVEPASQAPDDLELAPVEHACHCSDREMMSRCTQTDRSFCLVSILPTPKVNETLSSTFISSSTTSTFSMALNLSAFDTTQTPAALSTPSWSLSPKPQAVPAKVGRAAKRSVSESALENGANCSETAILRRASSLTLIG